MAIGKAFNSVCYQTLPDAVAAACANTSFWNNGTGIAFSRYSSYKSCLTASYAGSSQGLFTIKSHTYNTYDENVTAIVMMPDCVYNPTAYSDVFSYIVYSVLLAYLTSLAVGVIIKFVRDV